MVLLLQIFSGTQWIIKKKVFTKHFSQPLTISSILEEIHHYQAKLTRLQTLLQNAMEKKEFNASGILKVQQAFGRV